MTRACAVACEGAGNRSVLAGEVMSTSWHCGFAAARRCAVCTRFANKSERPIWGLPLTRAPLVFHSIYICAGSASRHPLHSGRPTVTPHNGGRPGAAQCGRSSCASSAPASGTEMLSSPRRPATTFRTGLDGVSKATEAQHSTGQAQKSGPASARVARRATRSGLEGRRRGGVCTEEALQRENLDQRAERADRQDLV